MVFSAQSNLIDKVKEVPNALQGEYGTVPIPQFRVRLAPSPAGGMQVKSSKTTVTLPDKVGGLHNITGMLCPDGIGGLLKGAHPKPVKAT